MGLFSHLFGRSKTPEVIAMDEAAANPSRDDPPPRLLRACDRSPGDVGDYAWDPAHNADLLTVGNAGATLEWGPRKPGYRGALYPPAWVPARTLLLLHSGLFR